MTAPNVHLPMVSGDEITLDVNIKAPCTPCDLEVVWVGPATATATRYDRSPGIGLWENASELASGPTSPLQFAIGAVTGKELMIHIELAVSGALTSIDIQEQAF